MLLWVTSPNFSNEAPKPYDCGLTHGYPNFWGKLVKKGSESIATSIERQLMLVGK